MKFGFAEFKKYKSLYLITMTLAACSILYELTIAQTLSLLAANTVIWYSLTVGFFLLGMGIGSFLSKYLGNKNGPTQSLVTIEILLSVAGVVVVPLLHFAHMIYANCSVYGLELIGVIFFFGVALASAFFMGFLTGIELPLLVRIRNAMEDEEATHVVLAVDYFGSLVGAILFPLVFVPNFEMLQIGIMVASVNLFTAIIVILKYLKISSGVITRGFAALFVLIVISSSIPQLSDINQYFLRKYYHYIEASGPLSQLFDPMPNMPEVQRWSSAYQKIDMVRDDSEAVTDRLIDAYSDKFKDEPATPRKQNLFLNGDFQINTSYEEIYHEYFAHVPIQMRGKVPSKVLVLGGGDGILIKELLKYPKLQITHIDLDPVLIFLAKTNEVLTKINHHSLLNKRVHTKIDDGYRFVRDSSEKFDAVYIDFPYPSDYNLAKLYSREFFYFVSQHLDGDGYMVFDASGIGALTWPNVRGHQGIVEENPWPEYYQTVKAAGYQSIIPYITTLDADNPNAQNALKDVSSNAYLGEELSALLAAAQTKRERELVLRLARKGVIQAIIFQHILSLQQGFIVAAKSKGSLQNRRFQDHGIRLHVLNRKRFSLAFKVHFPKTREVDWKVVNSIFQPTFPSNPWYEPRLPF